MQHLLPQRGVFLRADPLDVGQALHIRLACEVQPLAASGLRGAHNGPIPGVQGGFRGKRIEHTAARVRIGGKALHQRRCIAVSLLRRIGGDRIDIGAGKSAAVRRMQPAVQQMRSRGNVPVSLDHPGGRFRRKAVIKRADQLRRVAKGRLPEPGQRRQVCRGGAADMHIRHRDTPPGSGHRSRAAAS